MNIRNLFTKKVNWASASEDEKYRALQSAILSESLQELKNRISEGININTYDSYSRANILMYYASNAKNMRWDANKLIGFLKQAGININHLRNNRLGATSALHFAVIEKNFDLVKVLIEHGADIELKDGNGNTPLWKAVMDFRGETEMKKIITFLIERGASLDIKNNYGNSPRDLIVRTAEGIEAGCNKKEWDLSEFLL